MYLYARNFVAVSKSKWSLITATDNVLLTILRVCKDTENVFLESILLQIYYNYT